MKLHVKEPAQRGGRGRMTVLVEAAVPHEDRVRLQLRAVSADVARERFSRDLFFTFDQEPESEGRTAGGEEVLDSFERRHVVALVVRAASGVDLPVADLWLKRRRLPLLHRVWWLNVVVAVDREVRVGRPPGPISHH